jgi:CBS domain-containing protein
MADVKTVREVMTSEVETCTPTATAQEVAGVMAERDVGAVPIAEGDRLVGMVTDRDIVLRIVAAGKDPRTEQIGAHVSRDVVTVSPDTSIKEALSLMEEHQIRRLPVAENGRLVGIVSIGDLATKATTSSKREERVAETLEGISTPSRPAEPGEDRPGKRRA